jgi:hypothetical protein
MKKDLIEEGRISSHSQGIGTVTQEMVHARARELALINGRSPDHLSPLDLSQAKRELMGQLHQESREETLPTSERWDPVPGSSGKPAPEVSPHDEQTDAEKLVDEGVEEAEHDRMVEATRESLRKDR